MQNLNFLERSLKFLQLLIFFRVQSKKNGGWKNGQEEGLTIPKNY